MHSILVRSKLHRPFLASVTIPRPNLISTLHRGLQARITLVSAPAGFGKSTIIGKWIDSIEALPKQDPDIRVSWLSLDEDDNQFLRFIRYFVGAIEDQYPKSCAAVISMLYDKPPTTIEALVDVLTDAISQLPGRIVLVLDDLHLIKDEAIFAFLTRLVQYTYLHLHLVLITRVDPPLPLSRWRAQGQLSELRLHDLSFTFDETKAFFQSYLDQMPTDEMISVLYERIEGWVVGLRLVALALQNTSDYSALIAGFKANSNRYIIDYLMDDVLDQQSPSLQQFLISTSILKRFSPSLCAAVAEIGETVAQQHVNFLARANLFLINLSSSTQWYRYHHQFQSMLLSRLHERYDEAAIMMLHRQAAAWLAAHGQIDEAIPHLLAIPDLTAIADLIESQRTLALNQHRFHELEEWLNLLPMQLLNQRPALLVCLAWVHDHRLDYVQCLAAIQRAEALLDAQASANSEVTNALLRADIVALRVSCDRSLDPDISMTMIRRSWSQIHPYLAYTHCLAVVWLAFSAHRLLGDDFPQDILQTSLEQTTEWPHMARARLLYSQGILYWYRCNLTLAERSFQQGLHIARQFKLSLASMLCNFGLAVVASGRSQNETAEGFHLTVAQDPHFQNGLRAVVSIYALMGIYAARGEPEASRPLIERLKAHAEMMGRPYLINQVVALEAYLALLMGDLHSAMHWALVDSQGIMYSSSDRIPVIRANILLAEGSTSSLLEADRILDGLNQRHDYEHDTAFGIETKLMQVINWDKLGREEDALQYLGKVVQLAVPNGLIGPFIDRGQPAEVLLCKLQAQPEYSQLVSLLLSFFPSRKVSKLSGEIEVLPQSTLPQSVVTQSEIAHRIITATLNQEMVEALTDRELDILRLLEERLSNKEIAQKLVVSTHTVRNHAANIFGKLRASNRFQAVERARELGLLPPLEQQSHL